MAVESLQLWWSRARAFLALAVLWLLYALPDGVRDGEFRFRSLRFSGELLAVLTLTALTYRVHWGRRVRPLLLLFTILLCIVRIDRAIFRQLMYEEPLLYDQLFMVQHLIVLLRDLWSPTLALGMLGTILALAGLFWACARLLATARELLHPERTASTVRATCAIWILALIGSASDALALTKKPVVQWMTPRVAANVHESVATYRAVRNSFSSSPYAEYERITLTERPDVHLYIVESYGRVIWDDQSMRAFWEPVLERLEQRLAEAGVHSASAFSTSPIRGGRSWLADATLIMGRPFRYEAMFRHALRYAREQPTLVSFLKNQGYETIMVSPADRPRLGLSIENRYGYDRLVTFQDLQYTGQAYGWGHVPDQYSVGFVADSMVARASRPQFINFHLVTSHAPWRDVPPRIEDWRSLRGPAAPATRVDHNPVKAIKSLNLRFDRVDTGVNFRPMLRKFVRGYLLTLEYDLELLVDAIVRDTKRDRLLILIGDHQPPLLTSLRSSYDSPLHVLSRDPKLLEEFKAQGFTSGLRLPAETGAAIGHGGLFSLVARSLVRAEAKNRELPPLLRNGSELVPTSTAP